MAALMSYFAPPIAGEWGDEAEDNTDGVPVLRTTNFTADGRLSYDDLTYRSIDTEKKENKILQLGDIIIEKSGGTPKKPVGRCVYFDRDDEYDYFCSNFTAILRANTEEVNTKYLWYILQEHYKNRQCLKYQYKTNGIANLDIKDYLSHKEVELPPREVQDKRVEAMDYSQHLLDLHQELLDIMDNAVKSRFIEMFGDPVANSKEYPVYKFSDITTSRLGKMLDKKRQTGKNNYPYLANYNVQWFRLELDNLNEMDFDEADRQEFELKNGDLLVCEGGEVGRCAIWRDEKENCYFQKALHRVRCDPKYIIPEYLGWTFYWHSQYNGFIDAISGVSTIAHLPGDKLKQLQIIVPPLELQNQFADFVAQADKSKLTIQKSMDNLMELRNSLLQEYFG